MMRKPPVMKMQYIAREGYQRSQNLRRYGREYSPDELRISLSVLIVILVLGTVAAIMSR